MKIRSISILSLCVCLLLVRAGNAQDTHTVFGTRKANTAQDMESAITKFPYTWEVAGGKSSITFSVDGTGREGAVSFKWTVKNAQQLELSVTGSPTKGMVIFDMNYGTFIGTDFDGKSPVRGSIVTPKATAPSPTPMVAGATPAPTPAAGAAAPSSTPASGNPFFDHLSSSSGGSTTDALEKAIVNAKYTWEPEGDKAKTVVFEPNGVGQNTFFKITWRIKGPHDLEIAIPGEKEMGKIVLKFNADFTKYTATDFDGETPLRGHRLSP